MLIQNPARTGTVCLTIAVLALHSWLLWILPVPRAIGVLSFAFLCLLLSFALDRFLAYSPKRVPAGQNAANSGALFVMNNAPDRTVGTTGGGDLVNAFSIDLEDYFHTEVASSTVAYSDWDAMPSRINSSVPRLLDLLDEHNTRSTVFVLGWIARKYPNLVRQVAERGHEIACHSDRHRPVFRLDQHSFHEDTRIAKETIEDAIGESVYGYRAPSFSITPGIEWAFDVLQELGFNYDSSVNPVRHSFYGNPTASRYPYFVGESRLLEIPVATWRIGATNLPVGGGAYLRILPYQYIRAGLSWINRVERKPFTLYVHPWEIDQYQPVLKLNWKSRARQTWGISTMESRMARLLSSFRFAPINEVYSHLLASPAVEATAKTNAGQLFPEMAS
jgi:polysaccharide deacetylase family protein (PEP-CTERM system associated)